MIAASQVNKIVNDYIAKGDLDSFIEQFAAVSHNIHRRGNDEAIALCNKIESLLAALYAGVESEQFLRDNLQQLSSQAIVYISNTSFEAPMEVYGPRTEVELCELAFS